MRIAPELQIHAYYSEKELASHSSIAESTFRSWRHAKKGPPYRKLCGSVRYLGADYLDWLAAQPKYGDVMPDEKRR
jgi:hypothetical protein